MYVYEEENTCMYNLTLTQEVCAPTKRCAHRGAEHWSLVNVGV
jgi:hypothetical protein